MSIFTNSLFYVITFIFIFVAVLIYFNNKSPFNDNNSCKPLMDFLTVDKINDETTFNKIKTIILNDGFPYVCFNLSSENCRKDFFYMDSFNSFFKNKSNLSNLKFSNHDADWFKKHNKISDKECYIFKNCP